MNPVPVATSLVLICNVEEVLLSVPDEVLSSVPVEAQAVRKDKTIGAKRNHLNFMLPDISSSCNKKEKFGYCTLSGRYKQRGRIDWSLLQTHHRFRK